MNKDDDVVVELYPLNKLTTHEKVELWIESLPCSISHILWLDGLQDREHHRLFQPVIDHLLECARDNREDEDD